MVHEQRVADIVEVADERRRDPHPVEPFADMRHGGGGLVPVDGDAHDLGARAGESRDLRDGPFNIRRIRVGHALDDDRRAAADPDAADVDAYGLMARQGAAEDGVGLVERHRVRSPVQAAARQRAQRPTISTAWPRAEKPALSATAARSALSAGETASSAAPQASHNRKTTGA